MKIMIYLEKKKVENDIVNKEYLPVEENFIRKSNQVNNSIFKLCEFN